MEAETEKTRARIQEQTDVINQVEADLRQVSPGSGSTAARFVSGSESLLVTSIILPPESLSDKPTGSRSLLRAVSGFGFNHLSSLKNL